MKKFRCSVCEKEKCIYCNQKMKAWDGDRLNDTRVAICKCCNKKMKKIGFKNVSEYLDYRWLK